MAGELKPSAHLKPIGDLNMSDKTINVYYWAASDWTVDRGEADLQAELEAAPYRTALLPVGATHREISDAIRYLLAGRITANEP